MAVIRELGAIGEHEMESAQATIHEMVERAVAVSDRCSQPDQAARWQLYARVSAWHQEHHAGVPLDDCPVCGTELADVAKDSVLGREISEVLQRCREMDRDVAKGAEEWERDASRELLERLPRSLRGFADRVLPDGLVAVYQKAYVDELLGDGSFAGPLQALKSSAESVWELAVASYPLKNGLTTNPTVWPRQFEASSLARRCQNVARAIRLARQRAANVQTIKRLMERYVGRASPRDVDESDADPTTEGQSLGELPLRDQVETLRRCVTAATPILSLLRQLGELESINKAHAEFLDRSIRIADAADAMADFTRFPGLVFQQVAGLITALDAGRRLG